jgi:TetR/AcrR family transcriptional regulator, regulator of cefoperazone and chloramphenicol sensitivity
MGNKNDTEQTKAALIEAAGALFAERGYHGVTARQVVARAGVSLGGIPYHFGSMDGLYRETLIEACMASAGSGSFKKQAEIAEPLEALRMAVLMSLEDYSATEVSWQVKLIEREFLEPSDMFREVIRLKLRPDWDWLCGVIGRAVGLSSDNEAVAFGAITMHTLASTFLNYRRSIQELAPSLLQHMEHLEKLTLVLTSLTIDAVNRYKDNFDGSVTKKQSRVSKTSRVSRQSSVSRSKKS